MSHPQSVVPKHATATEVPHTAYQVDFNAVNCGRIVAASKRRICFKFGYTHAAAFERGKTGQECRGSEHEVSITWSLSSGKQAIAFDHQEVLFDVCNSTQTKFAHTWEDDFGHCLEAKIHAAPMSTKTDPDPHWQQYDLFIDGVSFFLMPKIFEIGIFPRAEAAAAPALGPRFTQCPSRVPANAPAEWNLAKNNADMLPPGAPQAPEPKPAEVVDLLSFYEFDPPAPAVATPPTQAAPVQTQCVPAQVAAPTYQYPPQMLAHTNPALAHAPAQTNQYRGDANCISPERSGYPYSRPAQDPSTSYHNAPPGAMTSDSNPCHAPGNIATPVTPPASSLTLMSAQAAPSGYGVDGGVQMLVNMNDMFGDSATAPATKLSCDAHMLQSNAHNSLAQPQGSNSTAKTPVMNPFHSAPACPPQGMMCQSFATPPLQQREYNNHDYPQATAQPGFGY